MIKFSTDVLKEFFGKSQDKKEHRKIWFTQEEMEQLDQPEDGLTGHISPIDDEIIKLSQLIPEQPGTSPCG